jgi:hypothetical protein
MILTLIILIPWVLTILALCIIILKKQSNIIEPEEDLEINTEELEIVNVAVFEHKAYWVHDNIFYEANVQEEPDFSTARPIDTASMSPRQLNKLFDILDELKNHGKE